MVWLRLQQNDVALVLVWTAPANLRLKLKFSFSYFRENFPKIFFAFCKKAFEKLQTFFAKTFENFCFRESFRTETLVDVTLKSIEKIWILSEGFENTEINAKIWAKTKIFAKSREFLLIFAFRENEKKGFGFNPKLTLFINMLKLDEITISESRLAKLKSQGTE
jgi:tRNA nucleotidyltransferase/poly(A) polymerase